MSQVPIPWIKGLIDLMGSRVRKVNHPHSARWFLLTQSRRHLQGEIADEFKERSQDGAEVEDLVLLAAEIVPYCIAHNAEADACDLLMEVQYFHCSHFANYS